MKFRALRYTLLLIALFSITLLLRASLPTVATGTWVAAGNLSAARSGACTVALSDGRLLISGGADATGPTGTADLFSTTGSWSAAASMTAPRSHQSCAVLPNGHVLVAGGTTSGGGITNSAEIYDPSADSWSQAGIMNDARSGATASVLQDGRVLIAGGQSSGGAVNTLEIFDPNSGNFSNAGTMSSPRQDHAAAVLSDGRVLIVGGSSDGANALATTDIYDPQAGSASAGPAMSTPRARHTATTLLDGSVVVIGGSDYTNDLASAELFDPAANNFNAASSLATARSKHSAFLLPNNNEVLVVGGQSAGTDPASGETDLTSAELYISWQKAFQATGAMATPRSDATGAALTKVNGRLLIAGGATASAELYGFATVKTDAADYPPGTTVNITGTGWQPGETVTLTLVESPLIDTHGPYPVVADAFGNISDSSFTTDAHDLNIRFYLTVSGSQSQAQNTFTDANVNVDTSVASNNNPAIVGQSVTFTATAKQNGNGTLITCGSIQFQDGGLNLGSSLSLNGSGQAQFTTSSLALGTHSITAVYNNTTSCSSNSNASNSVLSQGVNNPVPTTSSISPTSTTAGTGVTLTVNGTNFVSTSVINFNNVAKTTTFGSSTQLTATLSSSDVSTAGSYPVTVTNPAPGGGTSNSQAFTVNPGTASKLLITGSVTQTAGASSNLTITAQDANGNTATGYTGDKSLTFSGANASTNPVTNPTVADKIGAAVAFGGPTTITFANGVATVAAGKNGAMTLYKAETATIGATDGTISSSGAGQLSVTVSAATLAKFVFSLTSPEANAATFTATNTLTAQDAFGNTVTTFSASADNVTITANSPLTGTISGLGSGGNNVLNQAGNFSSGVANLTTLGMKYTGNTGSGTFTATSASAKSGTSGSVTISGGAATQFVITGSTSQTAGTANNLTITAKDTSGNAAIAYTGDKSLTFSGANPSSSPVTNPTVSDKAGAAKNFGTATTITFTNGVATVSGSNNGVMMLFKAETATISVTDGSISSTGANRLTVTVTAGSLGQFAFSLTSPQTNGVAFTGTNTLTAQDSWGNTVTTFNASDNVTITANAPLTGTVSGLGSGGTNVLNQSANFSSGVANLSGSMKYAGNATSGTFTATSSTNKTGTSGSVTMNGGAATKLAVSAPASATAGTAFSVTVTAQDVNGNTATGYTGTVHFTSSDGQAVLPANSTLTNGTGTFSATLKAAGTQTITATDTVTNTITGTGGNIAVSAAAASTLAVSAPATATAGTAFSVTVTAKDAFGNTATGYAGTVKFTSSDGQAALPANSTLTNGTGSLNATLKTAGNQTITATDTVTTTITGTSGNVNVSAAAATKFAVAAPASATAGATFSVTVTAQDAFNNTATAYRGTIHFSLGTADGGATVPSDYTFVAGDNGAHAFANGLKLTKAGVQTIIATDTGTPSITGLANLIVNAASATKLVVTGSGTQTAGTGNTLTITAEDNFGNTDATFGNGSGGNVSLTFSGASSSPDPATQPTATNKNGAAVTFGTGTALMFVNGVSSSVMTLYKAETANISVADGQGVTPGSLTVVVSTAAANKLALSGSTANLASGSMRAVIATVQDAFGNTIGSDTRSVTFTQTAGTGSVTGLGSSLAVAGIATQTVTGNAAGTVTITASASGLASGTGNPITFSVVAGAAAKLALGGATTDLASGSTRTLTANIQDAAGNTVNTGADSTIIITFAKTSGAGTVTGLGSNTAVAGVATVTVTGALAGSITITASGTASTGALAAGGGNPIAFNVVAGPAVKLALNGSTADLASGSTRQLTATIQDAGGNTVSTGADSTIGISFTKTAGTGTVTGLGSSSAVAGVAIVTVTGNLAGPVTITASGTASTGALAMGAGNPIAFNIVAGAAAKLAYAQQPANTTAGQTISAVTVQILDANGNLTGSAASVAMSLTGSPAGVTLSGTLTKAAVSGLATFNDLSINKGGTYTLSATSIGLTGATSASFTINNPAPTLTSILPAGGNLTQTLNVVFTGTNFISGVSSVNFGSDITVNTTTVDSATQITANITIAGTAATGARNVSVTNSAPGGGTSATQSFTVVNPATTTQVVSSLNPSTFGLSVTFTATVSSAAGTPTGSVIFYDGACGVSALTGSLNLASGQATFTTTSLNGGTHNISACYTPSGIFQSSFGSVSQVVSQATPTVTFTGAPATAYFSSQFTVSATTNASTTPTITASAVCTISATTVTITSGVGTCSLLASWAADTNYVAATATQSTSALPALVIVTVPDTTVPYDGNQHGVTPTFSTAVGSYAITYTGISPTVYATSSTAPTEPGSYSAVATIIDTNYAGSGSGTLTISQKDPALVLALLTGMPEPSSYGTVVYFELTTANAPCPTGQVQFFVDGASTPSATVTLTSTTCTKPVEFSTATLMPGTHTVSAAYGGDTYYLAQTSAPVSHNVVADATTVTLATSAMTVFVGDAVTLTATVTPVTSIDGTASTPSGTVQFYDGTTLLGENPLSSNTAMFTISSLPAGSHSMTATFVSASGDFSGNSSPVNVETVDKITPTITWPNPADIVYGTKLSATQLNATATDTHNGGITVNGTFTYNPAVDTVLAVGSRNLMVTFTPDDTATYGNQTASATINVSPATLTVTADDASRYYGANNPTFTFQYSGFVNSEDSGIVTTAPTCTSTADSKSNIGTYAITCSGGAATNYTIKYVDGKLTVNPAVLTASIVGDPTKPYDGNTTATLTSGNFSFSGLVGSDTITVTKTSGLYNSADVASANTVTVALAGTDFSAGTGTLLTNYTLPTSASGAGQITKANANIMVTPYSVTYDANPHTATGTAKGITGVALAGLDLSGTTHTNAGTYTDTWTFTDATGNYNNASSTVSDVIKKANAVITVTPYSVTYDGAAHTATGMAKGVLGETLSGLDLSGTTHTNAGTYASDPWTFTDTTGNYCNTSGTVSDLIKKANATITVTPYSVTYDGNAHTATGSATGVKGESLSGLDLSGTTHTNAGTYASDPWTFTDTTGNYCNTSGTVSDLIKKANAVITVTPYSVTYDGNAHMATGSATGVKGESLSGLDLSGTTHTNAGTYASDPWTFTDTTGNYCNASGTVSDLIKKANAVITVTPYSVTYDGNAHIATGSATGVKGESLSGLDLSGTTHTNAGTYASDPWTFTDATGNYCNTSGTVSDLIKKANAVITVTPYSVTYDGAAHSATGMAKGVLGETLSGLDLSGTAHTNAGTYASDPWTFTDTTGNYCNANGTVSDLIKKANAVITVTPYSVTYDGAAHSATGMAKGVLGETLLGLDLSGTTHTAAGTYTDTWTFTDVTGNYCNASGTVSDSISQVAAKIVVNGYSAAYDGGAHGATGTALGVESPTPADLSSLLHLGASFTNVPGGTANWTFDGNTNYKPASGTAIITIMARPITVTADAEGKVFGQIDPIPLTYKVTSGSLASGDSFSGIPTRLAGEDVGVYPISVGTLALSSNYSLSFVGSSLTISPATTMTSVVSSLPSSNYGQSVTFTATVTPKYSGTPTGAVAFYTAAGVETCSTLVNSSLIGGALLSSGQASVSTSTLPPSAPGTLAILACYAPDSPPGDFFASGGTLAQTVYPAPVVSLSPTSLSFGNQQAGTTSTQALVKVMNIGTAALSITGSTIAGTNGNYFAFATPNTGTDCRTIGSVAINASCNFAVVFKPVDTGAATAIVNITDNDKNQSGSVQQVPLTGASVSSINSVASLFSYGVFATANGCGTLTLSGGSIVDSFDSTVTGGYGASHQNSGGNVGTNGNLTLSGSNVTVYGSASLPMTTTGNCSSKSLTGFSTSGGAQVAGGLVQLSQPVVYAAPAMPSPAPPTTNQSMAGSCGTISGCTNNGSKNVILAPGTYGNLTASGGTTMHVSMGTYNLNSLTLSGNSILVVDSGPVVMNIAGNSLSGGGTALDLSGGSMSNVSGMPSNLQFYYGGSRSTKLSGGAGDFAVVYAPNSPITLSGGSHFYGAIVGNTITLSGGTAVHYDRSLPNIAGGSYIWFNSAAMNVQNLPSNANAKVFVTNATISFTANGTPYSLAVPNAVITFSPTATSASTSWDNANQRWSTLVPRSMVTGNTSIHTFLDGLAFQVPGNFPGGIQNATWSAAFATDTPGVTFQWQWAAAVYTSFNTVYSDGTTNNLLGVNPIDGTDPAGTPENYKSFLTTGGSGAGATNWTGFNVGTAGVVPTMAPASVSPSSLNFGTQTVGSSSNTMTAVLSNNQSGPLTITGITKTGTNAADFTETDDCPLAPATLTGGGGICTLTITFKPTATGVRKAKFAVNDNANNTPQTVFVTGTGQ